MAFLFTDDFSVTSSPGARTDEESLKREITEIIERAEREYGPRDSRYTIRSVVFRRKGGCDRDRSCVWPDHGVGSDKLIVYLAHEAMMDDAARVCFLAHECIHVLSFTPQPEITYLEEGVCEDFALRFVSSRFDWKDAAKSDQRYTEAREMVEQLNELCPNAIRAARLRSPAQSLSKITAGLLAEVCPSCPPDLSDSLVRKFYAY